VPAYAYPDEQIIETSTREHRKLLVLNATALILVLLFGCIFAIIRNDPLILMAIGSNRDRDHALYFACVTGSLPAAATLLDIRVDPMTRKTGFGTPLEAAVIYDRLDVAALLLAHGAQVDSMTRSSNLTPLMIATQRGYSDAVRFLLSKGANPRLKNDSGLCAYAIAKASHNPAVISAFRAFPAPPAATPR
jgi:ankyrin repeat protein